MRDRDLVARLESLAVREKRDVCAIAARLYTDSGASCHAIGDGIAVRGGAAIGVSSISGLGLSGAVSAKEHESVRSFLATCGPGRAEVSVVVGSDPQLAVTLHACGLRLIETEDVMVLPLPDPASEADDQVLHDDADRVAHDALRIEQVAKADRSHWARLVATAFSDGAEPPGIDVRFAECLSHREGVVLFRAVADGEPCGAAELWVGQGVGWLSADGTLPRYRRRGVQAALQRARIDHAVAAGCRLAVTEAVPRTSSAGNALGRGFRVAYTRMIFGRDMS